MTTKVSKCCYSMKDTQGLIQKIRAGGANKIRGQITRACWAAQLAFEWKIRSLRAHRAEAQVCSKIWGILPLLGGGGHGPSGPTTGSAPDTHYFILIKICTLSTDSGILIQLFCSKVIWLSIYSITSTLLKLASSFIMSGLICLSVCYRLSMLLSKSKAK